MFRLSLLDKACRTIIIIEYKVNIIVFYYVNNDRTNKNEGEKDRWKEVCTNFLDFYGIVSIGNV